MLTANRDIVTRTPYFCPGCPYKSSTNLPDGAVRFLMSLRATGEGHVSSIVFRLTRECLARFLSRLLAGARRYEEAGARMVVLASLRPMISTSTPCRS